MRLGFLKFVEDSFRVINHHNYNSPIFSRKIELEFPGTAFAPIEGDLVVGTLEGELSNYCMIVYGDDEEPDFVIKNEELIDKYDRAPDNEEIAVDLLEDYEKRRTGSRYRFLKHKNGIGYTSIQKIVARFFKSKEDWNIIRYGGEIDHLNSNPSDNRPGNLFIGSAAWNKLHAYAKSKDAAKPYWRGFLEKNFESRYYIAKILQDLKRDSVRRGIEKINFRPLPDNKLLSSISAIERSEDKEKIQDLKDFFLTAEASDIFRYIKFLED